MNQSFALFAWGILSTFAVVLAILNLAVPGPVGRLGTAVLFALAVILGIVAYLLSGAVGTGSVDLLLMALFLAVIILWACYYGLYFLNKDVDAADPAAPGNVGNS